MTNSDRNRKVTSFSIEKNILSNFEIYCKSKLINKSRLIEQLIINFINEKS